MAKKITRSSLVISPDKDPILLPSTEQPAGGVLHITAIVALKWVVGGMSYGEGDMSGTTLTLLLGIADNLCCSSAACEC